MIKVGQVVKLKNPKKREAKRRWRFKGIKYEQAMEQVSPSTMNVGDKEFAIVRRLDTVTHRLERLNKSNLVPISFWERITKRY